MLDFYSYALLNIQYKKIIYLRLCWLNIPSLRIIAIHFVLSFEGDNVVVLVHTQPCIFLLTVSLFYSIVAASAAQVSFDLFHINLR